MMEKLKKQGDANSESLLKTDIYLDRYMGCRILNLIWDVFQTSFSTHNDDKRFRERLVKNFKACKDKIILEEGRDK